MGTKGTELLALGGTVDIDMLPFVPDMADGDAVGLPLLVDHREDGILRSPQELEGSGFV